MSLKLRPLTEEHLPAVLAWMSDPAVREPLDLLPPEDPRQLLDGRVVSYGLDGKAYLDLARVYEVLRIATGTEHPIGFVVDYGWDQPRDSIRELDLALPVVGHPLQAVEALALAIDGCFTRGCIQVRGRTRPGATGGGFGRLFSRLGAKEVAQPEQLNPRRRTVERRVLYTVSPARFYASRAAQRYGLTAGT